MGAYAERPPDREQRRMLENDRLRAPIRCLGAHEDVPDDNESSNYRISRA